MANGKVDDLSWSQLRPRRTVPQCVLDSIPPEDLQSFLRLMAINPFLSFSESLAVRDKIRCLRQWRAESVHPKAAAKTFAILHRAAKRPREGASTTEETPSYEETDSEDGDKPKRKHRRSSRPSLSTDGAVSAQVASDVASTPVHIGDDYQATVPPHPLPQAQWDAHPPKVTSELVFSSARGGGDKKINRFVEMVNGKLRKRDGFGLAPFALEVTLRHFVACEGDEDDALKRMLELIPRGPYFPGIKAPFQYEEQCKFVRSLAERSKNFSHIARDVLPGRLTSELVWLYYTRHKQLWLQNGGLKNGQILDDGGQKLKRVPLTTERAISALRSLAITAGDGFPIDSRAQHAILACRKGNLAQERKRKDEENIRRGTRQRYSS